METRGHPLTIELEDYFHLSHGSRAVVEKHWDRLPSRVEHNADTALNLLKETGASATFFVHPWVAERRPELLRRISAAGHEVGCKLDRDWVQDASRVKALVEAATGKEALGCRIEADPSISVETRSLAAGAFAYESSLVGGGSTTDAGRGCPIPGLSLAGQMWSRTGLLLRQKSNSAAERMIDGWAAAEETRPLSFKVWELDEDLPRLAGMPLVRRLLSYRNVSQFAARVRTLLGAVEFQTVRNSLGLQQPSVDVSAPLAQRKSAHPTNVDIPVAALTVVVPCFNEEEGLSYLASSLRALEADAAGQCELSFVLVDDGSTDGTWVEMDRHFGGQRGFKLIQHKQNRGVAAAMLTGISASETEIVAVMDSDCSYEPSAIWAMLHSLKPGVALVTGSPYHTDGGVLGVPEWRLGLSRSASGIYRLLLRNKLATYTACFRVYRRRAVERVTVQNDGFLGVTELLARLDIDGWGIAEHPVVLESRIFGRSKLKVLRTTISHLKLMTELALLRLAKGPNPQATRLPSKDLERLP